MTHPQIVVHLEHDGKVLLVDKQGNGPQIPKKGRLNMDDVLRFPTIKEIESFEIEWDELMPIRINFDNEVVTVIKGYPKITWPKNWAWKDDLISDNSVHPIAREAVYRSIHRLVSKVIVRNNTNQILLAQVSRGHFTGHWTLPGGYMEHNEHPSIGCVREAMEELGLELILSQQEPIITQQIFTDEGISFVSFTYNSKWNGELSELKLQDDEISDVKWFDEKSALNVVPSYFDREAIRKSIS
ncbi:MAG: NUDIX hydrolase [Candidatus Poseidoniaceae archaeon]|nr:NUDIX hydrolase [Candidatus Poseidoniaceae archaeon]